MNTKKKISMMDIFKIPKYRGQHIILAANKVFTAKTGEGAAKILADVRVRYPDETPEIAYLPKVPLLLFCN